MPRPTKPTTLILSHITPADIPCLTPIWFAAFTDPAIRRLFPDTPAVRAWLTAANTHDATRKPFQKYVKVVDAAVEVEAECEAFFGREERERARVMRGLKHYYLDTLVTHPAYHRRGAGSMLLQWGCELADRDGVALYVDASKAGARLYERFGFVDESLPGSGEIASMVRRGMAR
ncbi:GNAT family N-acetyltransferase [Aspergillus mulundensis]|uniref:N-acetyltransferase domain-containing protein n=1 Tax=Aspergillus mulundensis TaxID=1810919 RepID=A0A3D8QZT6_9EURO|nr:hypothetical protein DSM5745_09131 [Aspergillus mulundensis]RDW67265.1 hypothetical protein DSM5745_09131 [Aspergillus mulundensis]